MFISEFILLGFIEPLKFKSLIHIIQPYCSNTVSALFWNSICMYVKPFLLFFMELLWTFFPPYVFYPFLSKLQSGYLDLSSRSLSFSLALYNLLLKSPIVFLIYYVFQRIMMNKSHQRHNISFSIRIQS